MAAQSGDNADTKASKEWVVWPKDPKNETQLATTEKLIKTVAKVDKVYSYRDTDNELVLWTVKATENQINTIKGNFSVQQAEENKDVAEPNAAMALSPEAPQSTKLAKRDITYTTQIKPEQSELVMISQPTTVPELDDLENYVYESHGGEGVYIYHIEHGVNADMIDEFPADRIEILQTQPSKDNGEDPRKDGSTPLPNNPAAKFHSTGTASKAAGTKYGVCKKCKLILVKMADGWSLSETSTIFDFVHKDIRSKPERKKKCVVVASWGSGVKVDPAFPGIGENRKRIQIDKLLKDDVIVVIGAGNYAKFKDPDDPSKFRTDVDTSPAVFEKDTVPLIAVGATGFDGVPADFSQGGDHVKIHAPGLDITAANQSSNEPLKTEGTSYAGPIVAGVIANYLAYDPVPFDTSDGKMAGAARDYLANKANWQRTPPTKVIWNEVTEKDNPKKGATGSRGVRRKTPVGLT